MRIIYQLGAPIHNDVELTSEDKEKHVPRVGDKVVLRTIRWKVTDVVWDLDLGKVTVKVQPWEPWE